MDLARDRRLRIHASQPALDYLRFLIENLKPLALLLGVDEQGPYVEARFGPEQPAYLEDRVEAWLGALDDRGRTTLETARGMSLWQPGWRGCYQGLELGPFFLRPPWAAPRSALLDLVIDPEGGFGSGQHPATQACLAALAYHCTRTGWPLDGTMLDFGAGTGVLSLAAARLGVQPMALELLPAARAVCRRNAENNGVALRVVARVDELGARFPLVVANLDGAQGVIDAAGALLDALLPQGTLVLGGFGPQEQARVLARFTGCALRRVDTAGGGAWVALTVQST